VNDTVHEQRSIEFDGKMKSERRLQMPLPVLAISAISTPALLLELLLGETLSHLYVFHLARQHYL